MIPFVFGPEWMAASQQLVACLGFCISLFLLFFFAVLWTLSYERDPIFSRKKIKEAWMIYPLLAILTGLLGWYVYIVAGTAIVAIAAMVIGSLFIESINILFRK